MSSARSVFATVLLLLGIVASVVAVPAWWAHQQVSTDAYLDTAKPVLAEPTVREALADRAIDAIFAEVGVSSPELKAAVRPKVMAALDTPVGERAWESALRGARDSVVDDGADGAVIVDLGPPMEAARERLEQAGLPLPADVPTTRVTLVQSPALQMANDWYQRIAPLAIPLVILTIALLALAVLIAPRFGGMLAAAGIGVAVAMLFLILVLDLTESTGVETLVAAGAPQGFAEAMYGAYVGSLRTLVFWVLGGGLAALVGGLVIAALSSRPRRDGVVSP